MLHMCEFLGNLVQLGRICCIRKFSFGTSGIFEMLKMLRCCKHVNVRHGISIMYGSDVPKFDFMCDRGVGKVADKALPPPGRCLEHPKNNNVNFHGSEVCGQGELF